MNAFDFTEDNRNVAVEEVQEGNHTQSIDMDLKDYQTRKISVLGSIGKLDHKYQQDYEDSPSLQSRRPIRSDLHHSLLIKEFVSFQILNDMTNYFRNADTVGQGHQRGKTHTFQKGRFTSLFNNKADEAKAKGKVASYYGLNLNNDEGFYIDTRLSSKQHNKQNQGHFSSFHNSIVNTKPGVVDRQSIIQNAVPAANNSSKQQYYTNGVAQPRRFTL